MLSAKPNYKVCLTCQEKGLKSKVRNKGGMKRGLGGDEFYDEEGTHHVHAEQVTWAWECSNGHRWSEDVREKCPSCEYPDPPKTYDPANCMCNYPDPCPNQDPRHSRL